MKKRMIVMSPTPHSPLSLSLSPPFRRYSFTFVGFRSLYNENVHQRTTYTKPHKKTHRRPAAEEEEEESKKKQKQNKTNPQREKKRRRRRQREKEKRREEREREREREGGGWYTSHRPPYPPPSLSLNTMGQVLTCCQGERAADLVKGSEPAHPEDATAAVPDGQGPMGGSDDDGGDGGGGGGAATPGAEQWVYVVRHGEREDDINEDYAETSDRPYDPPLTATGRIQARKRGEYLRCLPGEQRPTVVVSSPFLRCVQTACQVYSELTDGGAEPGKLIVHHALSEVHCPRVLRCKVAPEFSARRVEEEALHALEAMGCSAELATVAVAGEPVAYPETRAEALARYDAALLQVLPSRRSVVLVTHGEAVGRAVGLALPRAEVYQADYCACVTLRSAAARAPWVIHTESGTDGVAWSD